MSLVDFIIESNRIEGIDRAPTAAECRAHERLLSRDEVQVIDLEIFVTSVARADLRRRAGQNVSVDGHSAPPGGLNIEIGLQAMLAAANAGIASPHGVHIAYELLHPFTDGNGRSGRALWAWHMTRAGLNPFVRPFLHTFYYQTLSAARG